MTALEGAVADGDMHPLYMTVEQFAAHRQVGRTTVFYWLSLGLPSVKQGRTRRIRRDAADPWLDAGNANTADRKNGAARRSA